jgi:hypothetical protein
MNSLSTAFIKNVAIMIKSKNIKVQDFLDGIMLSDPQKYISLIEMRKIAFDANPRQDEILMYGGIIFSINSVHFSGLFVRKNHISFEFSNGFKMKDPHMKLEGNGKFRRHLKILCFEDIKNKEVAFFVKQAI